MTATTALIARHVYVVAGDPIEAATVDDQARPGRIHTKLALARAIASTKGLHVYEIKTTVIGI